MPILIEQSAHDLKREKVLAVARQLFREKGYRATSVEDIALRLGVTKAALYHYFKGKEQILIELYERLHSRPNGALSNSYELSDDVVLALKDTIRHHITFVAEHQDLAAIFFHEEAELNSAYRRTVETESREYAKSIEGLLINGMEAGVFRELEAVVVTNLIMGMCNWVYQWYKPSGKLSADQIGELAANLVAEGIRRRAGPS